MKTTELRQKDVAGLQVEVKELQAKVSLLQLLDFHLQSGHVFLA